MAWPALFHRAAINSLHCLRTWTVESYSLNGTSVHPELIHAFFDPPELKFQMVSFQMVSWSVQPFLHCSQQGVTILYNGPPPFPLKLLLPTGIWTPIQYMVAWAHSSAQPKRHLDRFSHFCGAHNCDRQTNQQTHRPCYSVCNNRLHLADAAIQPNNN